MSISSAPLNQNLAQPSKFLLSFDRLPEMTYFCTDANIPGVNVGEATQVNPLIDAPIPGDKMVHEPFEVTFLIDEELLAWESVIRWIKGYSFPENTDQYKNLSVQKRLQLSTNGDPRAQYSDALLTIYSNKYNPLLQISFTDMFPVSLTGIRFSTSETAFSVMSASAVFKYTNYDIKRF